jgi:hypothetical protein
MPRATTSWAVRPSWVVQDAACPRARGGEGARGERDIGNLNPRYRQPLPMRGTPGSGYMTCIRSERIATQQMRFKVMSKSRKALVLAAVLSFAAGSAAQAGGSANSNVNWHRGASAAPVCGGSVRSQGTAHDGRLFGKQCPLLAGDGGPTGAGDNNGRAELTTDTHRMFAGGRGGITGEFHAKLSTQQRLAGGRGGIGGEVQLHVDTHRMFAGGRGGISGDV